MRVQTLTMTFSSVTNGNKNKENAALCICVDGSSSCDIYVSFASKFKRGFQCHALLAELVFLIQQPTSIISLLSGQSTSLFFFLHFLWSTSQARKAAGKDTGKCYRRQEGEPEKPSQSQFDRISQQIFVIIFVGGYNFGTFHAISKTSRRLQVLKC